MLRCALCHCLPATGKTIVQRSQSVLLCGQVIGQILDLGVSLDVLRPDKAGLMDEVPCLATNLHAAIQQLSLHGEPLLCHGQVLMKLLCKCCATDIPPEDIAALPVEYGA